MKKFSFPLENVKKYREFRQREAEAALGEALAAEGNIKAQIDDLARRVAASNEAVKGSTSIADIEAAHAFDSFADAKKNELLVTLAKAQAETQKKRDALREALKQAEALRRLRSNLLDEYTEALGREDDAIVDDITTAKAARK